MSVQAVVSLQNFCHNVSQLVAQCKESVMLCPSLKANAYGHGLIECVRALSSLINADRKRLYAVGLARVSEVLGLRHAAMFNRVVLYGHATRAELNTLFSARVQNTSRREHRACENVEFFVGTEQYLCEIIFCARTWDIPHDVCVHIKCDIGMGRLGAIPEQFHELYQSACTMKGISVVGVCAHFSDTEDIIVQAQWNRFLYVLSQLEEDEKNFLLIHVASSGSMELFSHMHHNMVRPGITLYGAHPNPTRQLSSMRALRPVMKVISHISCIKKISKNHGVSYLSLYKPKHETYIAVVNAGYGDGIPIALSNSGKVCIRNKNYPIVGRVCMDMLMVDLGQWVEDIECNEEVLLWGDSLLSVDEQALCANTISYELLCNVGNNCRVEKVFLK